MFAKSKLIKTTVLAALIGLAGAAAVTPASARDFDRGTGHERDYRGDDRGYRGDDRGFDRHDRFEFWRHRHHRFHGWY